MEWSEVAVEASSSAAVAPSLLRCLPPVDRDVARYGATGPHPGASPGVGAPGASAWWQVLSPPGPVGLSPKERRGTDLPWAQHLQAEP